MKYYQAETHCHTMEVSVCSRVPAKYLVEGMIDAGYKYMFVTDHYHPDIFEKPAEMQGKSWQEIIDFFMVGYNECVRHAKGTDLKVFLGMEICLKPDKQAAHGSDFLIYGFDEQFLRDTEYLYRMGYEEYYKLMKDNDFLSFQAHPYRYGLAPAEPICYDGIEIVNTHPRHQSQNMKAIKYAMDNDLYTIGGGDVHSEEDIGRGGIMLPSGIESTRDLVQFYKENGSPELIVTFGA